MNQQPPKWLDSMLSWYCRGEKLEDLQGDLYEYFYRNLDKKGYKYASWIYFIDVLKFFRIYTVKQLKIFNNMNFFSLWQNYVKTSVRSLTRNRLFSAINIIGLAISMSVGVLMIIFISDLLSYDKFHSDAQSIYRLNAVMDSPDGWGGDFASTSVIVGDKIRKEYSGVENVVTLRRNAGGAIKKGDNVIQVNGHFASPDFFELFSFELLNGEASTVLENATAIVISENTAMKLFEKRDVVGEVIQFEGEPVTISGVFKNVPATSHMQFDIIRPLEAHLIEARKNDDESLMHWDNIWMYHTYFKLSEGKRIADLQVYLDQLSETQNKSIDHGEVFYKTQSLTDIVPSTELSNEIGRGFPWEIIYFLVTLVTIVILSASFNYTNLSIARSLRRAREVGVRKVVGASSGNVLSQFLTEAVLISFLSGFLSLGLFFLIRKPFLGILEIQGDVLSDLSFGLTDALYLSLFCVIVGVISGFLPALFLSKLKAKTILKDAASLRLMKGVNLRKVLIILQFALSIGFIMATVIGYRQYKHISNVELGFNTDRIFNVKFNSIDPEVLQTEINKLSAVQSSSLSTVILSSGSMWNSTVKYKDPNDSSNISNNYVDENYLPLHGFEFLAGENLPSYKENAEIKYVVVNEKLLEHFQMGLPAEAVGETLIIEGNKYKIRGVVNDFQSVNVSGAKRPFMFFTQPGNFRVLNIKLNTGDLVSAISQIDEVWREVDPLHPMDGEFFEKQVAKTYADNIAILKIVGFLSFLVITIASMGLLGMAVYTAETRLKEISIRKVLGATEKNLVITLSKGFVWMLAIAAFIAAPVTYYLFDQHVLANSANRININVFDMLVGVLIVFAIGAIAIGWQTMKAANTNPARTLRDE